MNKLHFASNMYPLGSHLKRFSNCLILTDMRVSPTIAKTLNPL